MNYPSQAAIVAAYGPRDDWEAAQVAKAAEFDTAAIHIAQLIANPAMSPEQIVALSQSLALLERGSRLALAALERRRRKAAQPAVKADTPAPRPAQSPKAAPPPAKPTLSAEKQAIWDRFTSGSNVSVGQIRDRAHAELGTSRGADEMGSVTGDPMNPGTRGSGHRPNSDAVEGHPVPRPIQP